MRIGQPPKSTFPTYQIGTDVIKVIGNSQNPMKSLTLVQVRDIFTGRVQNWKDIQGPDQSINVWVYASGEDVEQLFEQKALSASPVTTLARLAVSPEDMAAAVAKDANAIGLLAESWKAAGVTNLYTVSTEPVLVYTPSQPQGDVLDLIRCLQK